ncbi:amidase [Nevskia ramosa]|uniref:amidase n=1 Tax=Nevskia ramosa TaxID=64002 RepID=UPI003D144628
MRLFRLAFALSALSSLPTLAAPSFAVEEATIADIQKAILARQITATEVVNLHLKRIKAYDGVCVKQPDGVLGKIETIPNAGQINAYATLNLRPAMLKKWGFNPHKARSMTDKVDADPALPDALEAAAELDRQFAATGKLVGPLHGIPISVKDQYDTADLRTTSGADAPYANDRPPLDAEFVKRLRAAGAIIIGKANMGEYASGDRSSFGGVLCNPYDTERSPGRSSGGSGSSVAASLAVCSIAEESGPSARNPAKNNNVVGIAATQELVSRAGMIKASTMNDRVGPLCRTVEDTATVLDVISGYDPKDELTAFGIGRKPPQPYASYTHEKSLKGLRIGVLREFMNKALFTKADEQSIDIVERAVADLQKLGATIVDPGASGALFQQCVAKYAPSAYSRALIQQNPKLFPADGDHIPQLVAMAADPKLFPADSTLTIRDLGADKTIGEGRFVLDQYLKERGDANIKNTEDLINKSRFYTDVRAGTGFSDKKKSLEEKFKDKTLDISVRLEQRFALQQIGIQCMAEQNLDAVVYPTSNIPSPKLGMPTEPNKNGRSALAWTLLGANGFPALSVPAGFTTEVYDRVPDKDAEGGTKMIGPIAAKLPVNVDFLGKPFDEATLFRIAGAYEAATRHRQAPPGFGPVKK